MRGRIAFALAIAATAWSFLLILASFFYPAYSGVECRTTGRTMECVSKSATSFEFNGWWGVSLFAAVALVSLIVLLALHRVCTTGSGPATIAAWTGIGLLFAFSWVTGLSVGPLVLPAVVLLAGSAVLTPTPSPL